MVVCECEVCVFAAVAAYVANHKLDRGPRVGVRAQLRKWTSAMHERGRELKSTFISVVGLSLELSGAANLSLRLDRGDALDESVDFVGDLVVLLERVVHAGLDVLVELLIGHVAEGQLAVNLLSLGRANDTASDNDGDVANALNGRVQPVLLNLFGEEGGAEGLGRCVDHRLSYRN
jgi:hypothetical protein